MKNRKYLFILSALIFFGALLRFYNIKERGIFWADEAFFLNASKTVHAAINFIFSNLFGNVTLPFGEYIIANGGGYVTGAKPGFLLFETLSFFIFGVHDYAGIIVSALSGIASVWLVFVIGRKLFGVKTALVAAALLTFSSYHIIYSRSGLSVSLAAFFILLGIYFYLRVDRPLSKESRFVNIYIFLAGLSIGYAYSCHYSLFWAIFMILLIELISLAIDASGLTVKIKRFLTLFIGIAIPLLAWQLVTVLARFFISPFGRSAELPTYFEQLRIYFLANGGAKFSFQGIDYYIKVILQNDGLFVLLFFIIGSFFLLFRFRRNIGYAVLLVFSYVPFVMYSLYQTNKTPHGIFIALPFLILISSYGIISICDRVFKKENALKISVLSIIVLAIICNNFINLKTPLAARSTYLQALGFINEQGNYKHFSSTPSVSVFYAGNDMVYPAEKLELAKARQLHKNHKYRYLILDWDRFITSRQNELILEVMKRKIRPVFRAPYIHFNMLYFGDTEAEKMSASHSIDVYDLDDIF